MIIRKPYAILIKYFKVIHIVLFVLMTYLLFRVRSLYIFFRDFIKTGTYTYVENMVSKYINLPMIIFAIILVSLLLLIFFLMRQKKKPILYYLSATIFYFIMFASFLLFINVFNNLEYQTYSNQSLVFFRDLLMVLYYFNFVFLGVSFIRGFGFNIKKFNFEKDIKELDITEADREEIEVGVGIDVDKVSNFIRRSKRNFGYYFKENSYILIVFLIIIVLSTSAYIAFNKLVINKIYHEGEVIAINDIDYTVNKSLLTNKNKNGNLIKNKNTYYLIVDFNVKNNTEKAIKSEINNSRIKIGNNYYYPKSNLTSIFGDLGIIYKKQNIDAKGNNNYILAFEIEDANVENKNIVLQIYNYKKVSNGEAILYFKDVNLKPTIYREQIFKNLKLNEKIDFKNTYLKKGTFTLKSYEILDIVNYQYTKCDNKTNNGECVDYQASVVPSASKKILKVNYETTLDNVKLFSYLNLEYKKNENTLTLKSSNIKNLTPSNYSEEGVVLLEIPNDITTETSLKFIFNIWGAEFTYE